jgi:hypothetical protein
VFELACVANFRQETSRSKSFFVGFAAATLCVALLPLFATGGASFDVAREECYARTVVRFLGGSSQYDPDYEEDKFDDDATRHLFPMHLFNSVSTGVSLFGLCVWLFFSPHTSPVEQDLDRTLGSYFALQWLANLLVTASALSMSCTISPAIYTIGKLINLFATGLSVIGTNLLCHRYLFEKARFMIKLYPPPPSSSSYFVPVHPPPPH